MFSNINKQATKQLNSLFINLQQHASLNNAQHFMHRILERPEYNLSSAARELEMSVATVWRIKNGCAERLRPELFVKVLALYCRVVMAQKEN